jgi:hypothetical protein
MFSSYVRAGTRDLAQLWNLIRHLPPHYVATVYLIFFAASSVLAGLLASRLLTPRLANGPFFILFALAVAVIPPQILAILNWPDGRGLIRSEFLLPINLTADAILAIAVILVGSQVQFMTSPAESRSYGWGYLYGSMAATILALLLFDACTGNPTGYDALAYHLPLAASWAHTGSLLRGVSAAFDYPENMGLILRWILATGNDRWVFAIPYLSLIGSVYLLYRISRAVALSR